MAATPLSRTHSIRVVSVNLRGAAGQLDLEGVGIREVADFHGAGAVSKSLDEGVAVHSGLPQNAGEGADGQVQPVQGNHGDHGNCTAIGICRGSTKHQVAPFLAHHETRELRQRSPQR